MHRTIYYDTFTCICIRPEWMHQLYQDNVCEEAVWSLEVSRSRLAAPLTCTSRSYMSTNVISRYVGTPPN